MMAITKYMQIVATFLTFALIVNADIDKDTEQCASQLIGLSTCLPYVQGKANSPTLDCCSGLKQVLQKNKICLCILVKDRDDPKLGFKINATLALSLPQSCNAPSDVKECPSLLHLAPGSPDAKVFEDFVKSSQGTISTPTGKENGTSDGSSGAVKSESGRLETKWLGGHQMLFGLFLFVFLLNYRSN